ncbi:MAG: hypothetical protein MJ072_01230, partial [Clostridia bacterium]|nr:hypothetical protein [Clostridia bacterium]
GMMYFEATDGSDACTYKFYSTGKLSKIEYKIETKCYYTEDLKSLTFAKSGFALFDGGEACFYENVYENVGGEDKLVAYVYHQDCTNEDANEFGFVCERFGELNDEIVYEGNTYYRNKGNRIVFDRTEGDEGYPYKVGKDTNLVITQIQFAPDGNEEFFVEGSVFIDTLVSSITCYFQREIVDDEPKLYLIIDNFRYELAVHYAGVDPNDVDAVTSSFEIVGMVARTEFYSSKYLDNYAIMLMTGQYTEEGNVNNYGYISNTVVYDEDGNVKSDKLYVWLGEGSQFYDNNGELVTVEEEFDYHYDEAKKKYWFQIEPGDGCIYKVDFQPDVHPLFGVADYYLSAITRLETVSDGNYTVNLERVVASTVATNVGAYWSFVLFDNENRVESQLAFTDGTTITLIARTFEDDKITSTVYYELLFTDGYAEEKEEYKVVPLTVSVTVTKKDVVTLYTEDGKYLDILGNKIILVDIDGTVVYPLTSTYDESTSTYTITLKLVEKSIERTVTYTVKEEGGLAVMTEVTE